MSGRFTVLLVCAVATLRLCAQTNIGAPREELILTGIIDLSSYKRAFFRIEAPGQAPQSHTLAEGEQFGDVALLTLDSQKAKVTLRYRGSIRELTLNSRTSGPPAPSVIELQRDASHSAHHARRAQLDRENDERAADEGLYSK